MAKNRKDVPVDPGIDFKEYLYKYGRVRQYKIDYPIQTFNTWGSLSPVTMAYEGVPILDLEISLPALDGVREAIQKWVTGEESGVLPIVSIQSRDNKMLAISARPADAKLKKELIEVKRENDKLTQEKNELEGEVKDLRGRLSDLIGVLK